jgi:hypothetical protein
MNAFFQVLEKSRSILKIPIYVVVGNHDYLGTGNTTDERIRQLLCGCANTPLTKYEVLKRVSKFNHESIQYSASNVSLQYTDNFETLTNWFSTIPEAHRLGCYLAGRLMFKKASSPQSVEVLLTDSSDYRDTELQPYFNGEKYGTRGSISFAEPDSQTKYFAQNNSTNVQCRIIASHYPPKDFSPKLFAIFTVKDVVGRPGDLLNTNTQNIWVSAHTHKTASEDNLGFKEKTGRFTRKAFNYVWISCGSTTDYPPQALLLYAGGNKVFKDTIYPDVDPDLERTVLNAAKNYTPTNRAGWPHWANGEVALGMTKDYQNENWTIMDTINARYCLEDLIARLCSPPQSNAHRDEIAAVLLMRAAYHEAGWFHWASSHSELQYSDKKLETKQFQPVR